MKLAAPLLHQVRCRSARELLLFLLSFSLLSLYVTYQLGSLPLSKSAIQEQYSWGSNQISSGGEGSPVSGQLTGEAERERENERTAALRQRLRQLLLQLESEHLLGLSNSSKVALVRGRPSRVHRDLPLYQDTLLRHQFTVKVPSSLPLSSGCRDDANAAFRSKDFPLVKDKLDATKGVLFNNNLLFDWWALFCMTSIDEDREECCMSKELFNHLQPHQKVNRIPGLRDLLWSTEGLCNTFNEARKMSAIRHRLVSTTCFLLPEQYDQFVSVADALGDDTRWMVKGRNVRGHVDLLPMMDQKVQSLLKQYDHSHPVMVQQLFPNPFLLFGSRISLRIYILVTSILPLRAYFFKEGLVYFRHDQQNSFKKVHGRLWMMSQLWHYVARNFGQQMVETVILNIQHAVVHTLLYAELKLSLQLANLSSSKSTIKYRCQHCFQMLGFDVIFNSSFHPVILKVDGHPIVQEYSREDGWAGEKVKRSLLSSLLDLLFNTKSVEEEVFQSLMNVENVGVMGIHCLLSHNICLTKEDLRYLVDARRESKLKGGFRKIYPAVGMNQYDALLCELNEVLISNQKPAANTIDNVLPRLSGRHVTGELHSLLSTLERFYSERDRMDGVSFDIWSSKDVPSQALEFPNELMLVPNPRFLVNDSSSAGNKHIGEHEQPKCSEDPSTMPYIRSFQSDPPLNVTPPFSPNVMDYFANVSYEQLIVKVWAFALNCQSEARLDDKFGTSRPANYTLGLGDNLISFAVVDIRHTEPWVVNTYTLTIHRRSIIDSEPPFQSDIPYQVCSIKQECDFRVSPTEACGLQADPARTWLEFVGSARSLPPCATGDAMGRWVLPCSSCQQRNSCRWSMAEWAPFHCHHAIISRNNLETCLQDKKVLFIGDSTNRGMLHYLMERLNGTLTEWDKTHHMKVYTNLNGGRTSVSFAYYPQFWLPTNERPVFEKALYQLVQTSRPLRNDSSTVLVVGGVHWLATAHLHMLLRALKREGLEGIHLIMKTLGSGFHLPVDGVHSLSKDEQRKLLLHSMGLAEFAKHYNFEVVDTFNITIARYKDFLQGKCACHFHKVVPHKDGWNHGEHVETPLPWTLGQVSGIEGERRGPSKGLAYHVEGSVNAAYSEILISRLCREYRTP